MLVEREYQAAFREFVAVGAVDINSPNLVGETFKQSWQLMQQLEADLQAALLQEPGNLLLQQRLMQLRVHQLRLLHVIAGQGPRRNLL